MSRQIHIYDSNVGYDKYAAFYDQKLKFLDTFEQGYFANFKKDLHGLQVLDAGCGTGRNTVRLAALGANITAVDVSLEMLKIVKQKVKSAQIVQADVSSLPILDNFFDLVFCHLVLVHLKDVQPALEEFYRVTKDGGSLFLTEIHQNEPPVLEVAREKFKIKSYYHSAASIRDSLQNSLWQIVAELPIMENGVRISTIFECRK